MKMLESTGGSVVNAVRHNGVNSVTTCRCEVSPDADNNAGITIDVDSSRTNPIVAPLSGMAVRSSTSA